MRPGRPKLPFAFHMLGVRIPQEDMDKLVDAGNQRNTKVACLVREMISAWLKKNYKNIS